MNVFESYLTIFVLRCKLVSNMLDSKSLITGGSILVNGKIIYNPSYKLNDSDIVQLKNNYIIPFFNKFIKINKPSRWKKNRFFYKLKTRNPLSKRILAQYSIKVFRKINHYKLFSYYKKFWKKRKFPFKFINTLLTNMTIIS